VGNHDHSSGPSDPLGEFLTQYNEYLDGNRPYTDLPVLCTRPTCETKPPREEGLDSMVDRFFEACDAIFAHVDCIDDERVGAIDSRNQFWTVDKSERTCVK
jgi:hypothetical protein